MTLGRTPAHHDLFRSTRRYCGEGLSSTSIYALLHREGARLFPDDGFADLFEVVGRDCVPPRIVATVMVLQRAEGLSDREAVDRFQYDLRWKYAAGGLDFDYPGFAHTVLVDMRARLRKSKRPDRIFEAALEVAKKAGPGRAQASQRLDGAVRRGGDPGHCDAHPVCHPGLAEGGGRGAGVGAARPAEARRRLPGGGQAGLLLWTTGRRARPWWTRPARDAHALRLALDGRTPPAEVKQAAMLLATVVGQDLEQSEDGLFRIAKAA